MQQRHLRSLMQGAWILSLGALITKILSAFYRVPFQNLVGNTGFYVYQQVYPLYGLAIVLTLSGGPVYISKRVASAGTLAQKQQAARRAFTLMMGLGGVIFAGLFVFAPQIARGMADIRLTPLIRTVAWLYLIMPILAVARGFFQGQNNMVATATSQVLEQILRVAIIVAAAAIGVASHWSVYLIGALALGGALVGNLASALVLAPRLKREVPHLLLASAPTGGWLRYSQRFFGEGSALVCFAAIMILMQLVDSFTITQGLQSAGMTAGAARNLKGIYDRGQPFVQIGLVVATALAQSLLPALTIARKKQAFGFYNRTAATMLHLAIASAALATVGLIAILPFANQFLFGDRVGSTAIAIYSVSVVLVAAINAIASLLQSQDQFRATTKALIVGLIIKVMINTSMTRIFGISGSAIATDIALMGTLWLVHQALDPLIRRAIWQRGFMRRLGYFSSAIVLAGWFMQMLFGATSRAGAIGACIVTGALCILVALFAGYKLQLLTIREMLMLPGGRKLFRILQRNSRKEK